MGHKSKKICVLFIVLFSCLPIFLFFSKDLNSFTGFNNHEDYSKDKDNSINGVNPILTQRNVSEGRVYSNITTSISNCYINREQPSLNDQPSIYIQDSILSYADMRFKNIEAINYTREIETNPKEFVFSSSDGPIYFYQKFYVELSQYINNVSIFIQDINDANSYTDENSWEVAIVNCATDSEGTPNQEETLGEMQKHHPITFSAHWEVFNFKNSSLGPIFLNVSNTKKTTENDVDKYWFAIRVKIPPTDGAGPKFLYFNPDGGDATNIGEGDTYAESPLFYKENSTLNNVIENRTSSGVYFDGNLSSFEEMDEDRYFVGNETVPGYRNMINISLNIKLKNLTNSEYTYEELYYLSRNTFWWMSNHYKYLYSIDLKYAVNASDVNILDWVEFQVYDWRTTKWRPLSYLLDFNQSSESLINCSVKNPWEKQDFLRFINYKDNNSVKISILFVNYHNPKEFNVSINQLTLEMVELIDLGEVIPYDPTIQEMNYISEIDIINGTTSPFGSQSYDLLKENEDDFYRVQSEIVDWVAERINITCIADLNGALNGTYFNITTPSTKFYVWFDVNDSGATEHDPNFSDRIGIIISNVSTNATKEQVASNITAVLQEYSDNFSVSIRGANITLTNVELGVVEAATDGSNPDATNFTFVIINKGANRSVIIMEFEFNPLLNIDNSLLNVAEVWDWLLVSPNPIVALVELRISSNVSIQNPNNLTHGILEVYKGDLSIDYLPSEGDWIALTNNKTFVVENETTEIVYLDSFWTWILMQILNASDNNAMRMRLRYIENDTRGGFDNFNLTIDELTAVFHIQNAISSDINLKLGVGLDSIALKPSDIELKNLDIDVSDSGAWYETISDGAPTEGSFEFDVSSIWHSVRFDVSGIYDIYKNKVKIIFIESPEDQYLIGTEYYTVNVTNWYGDPLEDLEINFEVLDENDKVVYDTSAITTQNGTVSASLKFEEIGSNYTIRVRFAEEGFYASAELVSNDIRVVDELTLGGEIFIEVLPSFLILISAFASYGVLRQRRVSRSREFWAKEAQILDDLLKISYIMIIHKDIGLTIFDKQISLDLDADLIGGFITAISQFRSEIKKDTSELTARRGFEMDYHDFKIVLTDAENVRVALILEGVPSENLKEAQWKFTSDFENKYHKALESFNGDINTFSGTRELVELNFNTSLINPLQLGEIPKNVYLEPLEKALVNVAKEIQKEKKFFFVSNLLNFGVAGRQERRDHVVSAILNLKRKGIINPIEIE